MGSVTSGRPIKLSGQIEPSNQPNVPPVDLADLLARSASMHRHLCPRQVLGVRMGLYAGMALRICVPQYEKRLITIVEIDGCAADGISVATNCWLGRRTLFVKDFGKLAATFVDTQFSVAIRISPVSNARELARAFASSKRGKWQQQLEAYKRMPMSQLFRVETVALHEPIARLVSHTRRKPHCDRCGEEIRNEREVDRNHAVLCRACAGQGYYKSLPDC